jgi:DNA (cytosine-5)-methyltransferase 1
VSAYYSENDPKAAAWLRELIKADLIAPGDVDERSVVDVRPSDLAGFQLIRQCKPASVFGEQVASAAGLGWWDRVALHMEVEGYAVAAFDLCAASVQAFHNRPRLWFVASDPGSDRRQGIAGGGSFRAAPPEHAWRQARRAPTTPWVFWEVKPCVRRAADALPGRVGRLRGYGNAIDPTLAAEFISAYLDVCAERAA